METRKMFCPQCAHEVTVTLDFGAECRDERCAISALPRVVMGVRLAKSGLRPERMEHVQALCEGCERVVQLAVVDESHAVCPDCETVNRWTMVRLDGEEWVAVTGRRAEAELG
jgi:hypothetical protein